jgi:hypothetical protein
MPLRIRGASLALQTVGLCVGCMITVTVMLMLIAVDDDGDNDGTGTDAACCCCFLLRWISGATGEAGGREVRGVGAALKGGSKDTGGPEAGKPSRFSKYKVCFKFTFLAFPREIHGA